MDPTLLPRNWLVIFDPTLRSLDGHSHNYDFAIADVAQECFDQAVIFADRSFRETCRPELVPRPILESIPIRALRCAVRHMVPRTDSAALPNSPSIPAPRLLQQLWKRVRARGFADSVARSLAMLAIPPTDCVHLLVQQADLYELAGAEHYGIRFAATSGPHVIFHLLLRHDVEITQAQQEEPAEFRRRLIRLSRMTRPRVHFYTDSLAIAKDYDNFTGRQAPVNVLPIPVSRLTEIYRDSRPAKLINCLRVAVMGASRIERGFGTLDRLIPQFPARISNSRIHIVVQVNRRLVDPEVRRVIRWLDTFADQVSADGPILELWDGPVPDEVYFSRFAAADILITPCISAKYARSTSSVFNEALHLGIPAVVMHGTWAAGIIEDASMHGLLIGKIARTIDAIPHSTLQISERLPDYHVALRHYLEIWKGNYPISIAQRLLATDAIRYPALSE